jgi:hypothetical protein
MAETAPIASSTAAAAEVTPSMDVSPPLSEETVVASPHAASPPPEPLSERVSVSEPQKVDEQLPMPHLNLALFSTDGGQHEPRKLTTPAYWPPVIVRSNGMQDVVEYAARWRQKLPNQYHCIFPGCGYHITDFWDEHDIHLDNPHFLEDVLKFIKHENLHLARQYAVEWATKNRERLSVVASDDIYDPRSTSPWGTKCLLKKPKYYLGSISQGFASRLCSPLLHPSQEPFTDFVPSSLDPISCVDKIFINGETEKAPRPFLWHVANIMRTGMLNAAAKQQAANSAANAGEAGKAVGSDARKSDPKAKAGPVAEKKAIVVAEEKQPKPGPTPGSGPRKPQSLLLIPTSCKLTVTPEMLGQPPLAVPGSNQFPPENYPYLPQNAVMPSRPVPPSSAGMSMGPPTVSSPQVYPAVLRNPKGRNARQGSGSYNQAMGPPGWVENMPHAQQPRQFSGGMPNMHLPAFQGPPPMGQHQMNPMAGPPPFSPRLAMASQSIPQNLPYMPGPQGTMHAPGMFGSPGMGPMPPNFAPVGPMGDMTNNGRFPPEVNDPRMGPRPPMNRRNSRVLFNPYGSERPDFANMTTQPNGRKGNRSSFSNGASGGRNRNFSHGSQNRPNNFPYDNHPAPPNAPRINGRPLELPYPVNAPPDLPVKEEDDPTVIGDRVRGCGDGWIGPENDFVTHLIMFQAQGISDRELFEFFGRVGPSPSSVKFTEDKKHNPIAYI